MIISVMVTISITEQRFSKYGLGTSSSTGELGKNSRGEASHQTILIQKLWEQGPAICVFTSPPDASVAAKIEEL